MSGQLLTCDRCDGDHLVVRCFFDSLPLCESCRTSFTRWLIAARWLSRRPANDPPCSDATTSKASEGR